MFLEGMSEYAVLRRDRLFTLLGMACLQLYLGTVPA
jgi:hypothetical protein